LCAPSEAGAIQPVERVRVSARPVASVAESSALAAAKRTQRDDKDCIELWKLQCRGGRGATNRRRQHVRDRRSAGQCRFLSGPRSRQHYAL